LFKEMRQFMGKVIQLLGNQSRRPVGGFLVLQKNGKGDDSMSDDMLEWWQNGELNESQGDANADVMAGIAPSSEVIVLDADLVKTAEGLTATVVVPDFNLGNTFANTKRELASFINNFQLGYHPPTTDVDKEKNMMGEISAVRGGEVPLSLVDTFANSGDNQVTAYSEVSEPSTIFLSEGAYWIIGDDRQHYYVVDTAFAIPGTIFLQAGRFVGIDDNGMPYRIDNPEPGMIVLVKGKGTDKDTYEIIGKDRQRYYIMDVVSAVPGMKIFEGEQYIEIGADGVPYLIGTPEAGTIFWSRGKYYSLEKNGDHYDLQAAPTTPSEGKSNRGSNAPVQAPPSDYNDTQKVQYYLSQLGFNIGVDKSGKPIIDGNLGVKSASSIILFQQKMGLPITGLVDNATLAALTDCAQKGISYDDIMKKEGKELAPMPEGENGKLNETNFTKIPDIEGTSARLPEKAAVAWANLVQAAAQDPNFNMNVFYVAGPISGYRDIKGQRDLKEYWRKQGKSGNAADPGFSDHGLGRAIDLNVSDPQTGVAQSYELKWLEKNAQRFGFVPLLDKTETEEKRVNYYKETWHWIYTG
jgi:LAS superfamily LD-carboxypeptidase LdcB